MNKNTRDLLLKIKNSSIVKLNEFFIKYSEKSIKLLEILYDQGFIQSFKIVEKKQVICVFLRYFDNKSVFEHLKLFSNRLSSKNVTFLELSQLFNKRFVLFLTTNKGLATHLKCKVDHLSGKPLFFC